MKLILNGERKRGEVELSIDGLSWPEWRRLALVTNGGKNLSFESPLILENEEGNGPPNQTPFCSILYDPLGSLDPSDPHRFIIYPTRLDAAQAQQPTAQQITQPLFNACWTNSHPGSGDKFGPGLIQSNGGMIYLIHQL
ncbi:hypothetical protein V6N11_082269 [Hibiscus sabdariffa]|uniref:Uncharacterized protein n=1 Tax=Hibiscus sabdariffa TaxID=183260 RepID=A0ABR2QHH6_9ROSI